MTFAPKGLVAGVNKITYTLPDGRTINVDVKITAAFEINFDFSKENQEVVSNCKIQLFSSDGRKIIEESIQNSFHTINRNGLTNGIYFYSIVYQNESIHLGKITFN